MTNHPEPFYANPAQSDIEQSLAGSNSIHFRAALKLKLPMESNADQTTSNEDSKKSGLPSLPSETAILGQNTFGPACSQPLWPKTTPIEKSTSGQWIGRAISYCNAGPEIGEELNAASQKSKELQTLVLFNKKLICLPIGSTHQMTKAIRSNDSEGSDVAEEGSAPINIYGDLQV